MRRKYYSVCAKVDETLKSLVEEEAARRGISVSSLIKLAILKELNEHYPGPIDAIVFLAESIARMSGVPAGALQDVLKAIQYLVLKNVDAACSYLASAYHIAEVAKHLELKAHIWALYSDMCLPPARRLDELEAPAAAKVDEEVDYRVVGGEEAQA